MTITHVKIFASPSPSPLPPGIKTETLIQASGSNKLKLTTNLGDDGPCYPSHP